MKSLNYKYLRYFSILSVLVLTLSVLACSSSEESTESTGDEETSENESTAGEIELATLLSAALNSSLDILASEGDGESCTSEESNDGITVLCACTTSGTVSATVTDDITHTSTTITVPYTFTFSNCVVSGCDGDTTITGSFDGSITPAYEKSTATLTLQEITAQTDDDCSGLSVDDSAFGFSLAVAYTDDVASAISGSACSPDSGATIDLGSGETDVSEIIDTSDTCSE